MNRDTQSPGPLFAGKLAGDGTSGHDLPLTGMNWHGSPGKLSSILIVDECPEIRAVIRATVEDLVCDIWEAEDGCDGTEIYRLHKPTWVTVDLYLEPINGLTAMRMMKAGDPGARIIIISAWDSEGFREIATHWGAAAFVSKFDLWSLRQIIAPGSPNALGQAPIGSPGFKMLPREGNRT